MKYHDTMAQAQQKMTEACWFLEKYQIPPTPINYHVVYCYISKAHAALCDAMENLLANNNAPDAYVLEQLFNQYLSEQDETQRTLISGVGKAVETVDSSVQNSSSNINQYIAQLDDGLVAIENGDPDNVKTVLNKLIDQSYALKTSQQQLQEALLSAQKYIKSTKAKLQEVERKRNVDPLTGLFQTHYMLNKAANWLNDKREICAIAIDIDDFSQFNERYGPMIGDVVLSKVASKVRSYVKESGLPVRYRGEEFLVLLPDVPLQTATEIAEKMRSGVEKLKFVSSRSGRRLPSLTVSLGVSKLNNLDNIEQLDLLDELSKDATHALAKAKLNGKNQVVCAH